MTLNDDVILAAITPRFPVEAVQNRGALPWSRGPLIVVQLLFMWRAFGAGVPGARFSP